MQKSGRADATVLGLHKGCIFITATLTESFMCAFLFRSQLMGLSD